MNNHMKKILLVLIPVLLVLSCQDKTPEKPSYFMYVASSYPDDNQGIGIYTWDTSEGSMELIANDSTLNAISYLDIDPINHTLYSISREVISAFKINSSGSLTLLNELPNQGKGPCHVSVTTDQKHLLVGYYSSGTLAAYSLAEDGSLGALTDYKTHFGSSIDTTRQQSAHVHQVLPVAESSLILVPDLGMDKVMVYDKSATGILTLVDSTFFANIDLGGGPRHAVAHPLKNFVYVLQELKGKVSGFHFDNQKGFLEPINTVSTLAADFDDFNKSADIHITPNGQYLYASNRGPNTLAIFSIDQETGALTFIDSQSCGGDWPRAFAIDPSGQFILVANKNSNQITIHKIDYNTGLLENIAEVKTSLGPQCIRFLKKG